MSDAEPAQRGMPPETAKRFGYGTYAARFGNIYTVKQFRQLIDELNGQAPALPIWQNGKRFWDAMRPGVEPDGLAKADHVAEMRAQHLAALAHAISQTDVIIFTLGLTEAWEHRPTGTVYPTAPGTIAGTYDPDAFRFVNYTVQDILAEFHALDMSLCEINPNLKWLLTVSPVPLAAPASGTHVLPATIRSKSVLRVVCDTLTQGSDHIDYFPSYELVTSPAHTRSPFAEDLRSVRPEIVARIMQSFLAAHGLTQADSATPTPDIAPQDDAICEDILLDAFRPGDAP